MSQAQNYSAIWSSLITLQTINQEPSRTFSPLSATPTISKELRKKKRHQKLAAAVAFIGATSPDSKTVTACSSEISFPNENKQPVVTLRIAQNQPIDATEMESFRGLLKDLADTILSRNVDWNIKKDRRHHIESVTNKILLPLVVTRCRTKISSILEEPSAPFRAWYAAEQPSPSFLDSVPGDLVDELKAYFSGVNKASGPGRMCINTIALAIRSAHHIISLDVTSSFPFEQRWTKYDTLSSPSMDGGENTDDYETLDEVDFRKSLTHRFLHKLARYRVVCHTIVRELVALRRSGHNLDIAIETVPVSVTNSSPSDQNEYPDLDTFLLRGISVDAGTLDSKKLDTLRDMWGAAWKDRNLVLHAEMQLALFYATHDQIFPVQGYIGVSRKCCWCCNFVLKHLQTVPHPLSPDQDRDKYTEEATGLPLIFSVDGTHGTKPALWTFPNPSKDVLSHTLDNASFIKVCRRFEIVRGDMQKVLLRQVRDLMPQLHKPEDGSYSSGLSDDSDASNSTEARNQTRQDLAKHRTNQT